MKVRGTDFVLFHVSDLPRAAAFYCDVLGLRCEIESVPYQWAKFDCGNVTLSLMGNSVPTGVTATGEIALAVEDVPAAYRELTERGVWVEDAPVDSGFCVAFKVKDPDGNVVIVHRRHDGSYGPTSPTHPAGDGL